MDNIHDGFGEKSGPEGKHCRMKRTNQMLIVPCTHIERTEQPSHTNHFWKIAPWSLTYNLEEIPFYSYLKWSDVAFHTYLRNVQTKQTKLKFRLVLHNEFLKYSYCLFFINKISTKILPVGFAPQSVIINLLNNIQLTCVLVMKTWF